MKAVSINHQQDESQLVAKAQNGDHRAFQAIIEKHQSRVYSHCLFLTKNDRNFASDIFQEVFIKAFLNIKSYREEATLSTWLYRITINTFITELQKEETRTLLKLDDISLGLENSLKIDHCYDPESIYSEKELLRLFETAIAPFSERRRTIVKLGIIEDLPYPEIADIMNVSIDTVRNDMHLGRLLIREFILKAVS